VAVASGGVAASQPIVPADGAGSSTITILVLDLFGRPFVGQEVSLSAVPGAGIVFVQPGLTDGNGMAVGSVASSLAQSVTITATVGGTVKLVRTATVRFIATFFSSSNSTVIANPASGVPANGASTSTITVTLRDANSNPIAGAHVTLVSSGAGNIIAQPLAVTNGNGVATGTIASTVAETKTVSAFTEGTFIKTVTLSFAPAP